MWSSYMAFFTGGHGNADQYLKNLCVKLLKELILKVIFAAMTIQKIILLYHFPILEIY